MRSLLSTSLAPLTRQTLSNLSKVKRTVVVSSCKGGVGKSTVAVNLAYALYSRGHSVGLLDADLHGPSIPKMIGRMGERVMVEVSPSGGKSLYPVYESGVACMSVGFMSGDGDAIAWRGPMTVQTINTLLGCTEWGALDYLIVDMPPGTSDIHLTIGQQLNIDGAVVVTTPQEVALIDVVRGIDLFRQMSVPVLGVVANMDGFVCGNCTARHQLFGTTEELEKECAMREADIIGRIPLVGAASAAADRGLPHAAHDPSSPLAACFDELAAEVEVRVEDAMAGVPAATEIEMAT